MTNNKEKNNMQFYFVALKTYYYNIIYIFYYMLIDWSCTNNKQMVTDFRGCSLIDVCVFGEGAILKSTYTY